jgi:hypothetical protein
MLKKAGLRELPCQRMFASARSHQQDIHARPFFPDPLWK